jgi:uncharacterized Zn finger protein
MSEERVKRRRRRRPRRRGGAKGDANTRDAKAQGEGDAPRTEGGGRAEGENRPARERRPRGSGRNDGRSSGGRGAGPRGRGRARGRPTRGKPRRQRVAENWWARRWIQVLESFEVGRRLGRGRSYARQGQVVELELEKGSVSALVQGSRDAPYLVRMRFSMLSSTDWKKVTRAISADADLSASLVSGVIPENIEGAFEPLGLSLFPATSGDLKTACSCPDQANPCKHIAAVYYLLGEEFDRDPFLIFRLRGIDRSEIVEAIGGPAALRGAPVPAPEPPPEPERDEAGVVADRDEEEPEAPSAEEEYESAPVEREPEPLPTDAHAFWAGKSGTEDDQDDELRIPTAPGALARRLGGYLFWRGKDDCAAVIDRAYHNASIHGIDVYLGETGSDDSGS